MKTPTQPFQISKFHEGNSVFKKDLIAVEEPMEIRIIHGPSECREQTPVAVTMRTPGHDFELAAGFLLSEGIISHWKNIEIIRVCNSTTNQNHSNTVVVELNSDYLLNPHVLDRRFYVSSSCGICGKSSIESIKSLLKNKTGNSKSPTASFSDDLKLKALPSLLRESQVVFKHTGGIHGAALIDANFKMVLLREDVGRHNAVDKVVGAFISNEPTGEDMMLLVSGRISFELVQKAIFAGFCAIAGLGAPSTLAVELAREYKLRIIGFLKEEGYNDYS